MDITAISAAAVMFVLGATSPGPSLAVILRNTVIGGRVRGLACAIGHGIGFGFYAVTVVFGLVIVMEQNPEIFSLMQALGALFLLYLGFEMIRHPEVELEYSSGKREGFLEGFFIAFLNPKIAVFMLAVLSSVLHPDLSTDTKWIIAVMGMTIDTIWYALVALTLSNSMILTKIKHNQRSLYIMTGILMILLAVWTGYRIISN